MGGHRYDEAGSVRFSDPNLDGVQHITRTAAMSNFQSIPTDCPQRERRGWLGDAQLSSETNVYNFNMAGAYSNFVALINDAQNNESNATQDCVPWYGHGHEVRHIPNSAKHGLKRPPVRQQIANVGRKFVSMLCLSLQIPLGEVHIPSWPILSPNTTKMTGSLLSTTTASKATSTRFEQKQLLTAWMAC